MRSLNRGEVGVLFHPTEEPVILPETELELLDRPFQVYIEPRSLSLYIEYRLVSNTRLGTSVNVVMRILSQPLL